jgi:hypothetical protein
LLLQDMCCGSLAYLPAYVYGAVCIIFMLHGGWCLVQDQVPPTRSADRAALLPCQLDVRDGRCAVAGGGGLLLR